MQALRLILYISVNSAIMDAKRLGGMRMGLLYGLEKIRLPGLNEAMLAITELGGEAAFLAIALAVFWCVDKRRGYYLMSVGFFGTIANQILKLLCRVPRPWVLDENFTILEPARAGATGYSFPSGHTQNAVGTFGALACTEKRPWVRNVCIALAVLIPFSRMYVGVHTPWDVLAAAAMAVVLIFLLRPLALGHGHFPWMLGAMAALAVGFVCFAEFWPFPPDMDAANLAAGVSTAYTMLGAVLGVVTVYAVDEAWLHFPVKAVWWAQGLKLVLGIALVLLVKSGLKAPLNALFGGAMIARTVRYFLVVTVAGIVWPLSFRWFSRLGGCRAAGRDEA